MNSQRWFPVVPSTHRTRVDSQHPCGLGPWLEQLNYDEYEAERLVCSAAASCFGCVTIRDAIIAFGVDPMTPDLKIGWRDEGENGCHIFLSNRGHSVHAIRNTVLELFRVEEKQGLIKKIGQAAEVSGNTGSEESLCKALAWIEHCMEFHSTCPDNSQSPMPRGVLDLSRLGADINGTVCLRETHYERGKYACLSHCWGSSRLLQTTSANFDEHKNGIFYNRLPKTFRDAIIVAQKLNISYIWIDSLCIVQDDKLDWERESADMATIYQNSCITISASNSTGPADGCFVDTTDCLSLPVVSLDLDGQQHTTRVRESLEHGPWPLMARGWVFQEHLLSPRVLHFGDEELVWDCFNSSKCECTRLDGNARRMIIMSQFELHTMSYEALAEGWRNIVEDYSATHLTLSKYIFPALSGAAKQMKQYRKSRYLAGLWEDTLVEDLQWKHDEYHIHGFQQDGRPEEWRAPTWSWASIVGGVDFIVHNRCTYIRILEADCEVSGLDPTGELKTGHILLSGQILPGMVYYGDNDGFSPYGYTFTISGKITAEREYVDYDITKPGRWYIASGSQIFYLKLASDLLNETYLILRCINEVNKVYERVGICEDYPGRLRERYDYLGEEITLKIV